MTAKQEKLVTDNVNLVYQITQNYRNRPNYEDIVAEGMLGLCVAASNFDEIRGNNFSTYAYMTILGKVLVFVKTDTIVKPSRKNGKYLPVHSFELDNNIEGIIPNLDNNLCFYELSKRLSDIQFNIIKLLYSGYKKTEICNKLNYTQNVLNKELKNIQKIFKELYRE